MTKRKPAKRTHKPGSPAAQYDFVNHCQRLIAARIKAGLYHDNPALEATIKDFDPAVALIEIAANPANEPGLRGATAAKLLPFWHKEQSLMVKTADHAGTVINISIAAWAALPGSGAPKAIAARPAIDHVADDRELAAHRQPGSVVTPEVIEPIATVYEMDNGRPVRTEDIYPAKRPLLNPHTGQPFQGTPPERVTPIDLGGDPFK
jgi:hypothetical protein